MILFRILAKKRMQTAWYCYIHGNCYMHPSACITVTTVTNEQRIQQAKNSRDTTKVPAKKYNYRGSKRIFREQFSVTISIKTKIQGYAKDQRDPMRISRSGPVDLISIQDSFPICIQESFLVPHSRPNCPLASSSSYLLSSVLLEQGFGGLNCVTIDTSL